MRAFRLPDGQIHMEAFPVGAQLLTVDDMDGPFGRVALAASTPKAAVAATRR